MNDLRLLDVDEQVATLADELIKKSILPTLAARDAPHLSFSAVHRMHFLLAWNWKHIADPHIRERIHTCFSRHGSTFP